MNPLTIKCRFAIASLCAVQQGSSVTPRMTEKRLEAICASVRARADCRTLILREGKILEVED